MSMYDLLTKLEKEGNLKIMVENNIISKPNYNKYVIYKKYLEHRKTHNKTLSYTFTAEDLGKSERWVRKCVGFIEGRIV